MKRNVLGRGLGALISEPLDEDARAMSEVDIDLISPNPNQPRKDLSEQTLMDLVNSIKEIGILQPLIVTREEKRYLLIAGERRWRAAQLAGLKKVPVVIRDFNPQESLEVALIENLQREDLNPIEEAKGYEVLVQEYGLRQEDIARKIGKDRTSVTNALRLLQLPKSIQDDISAGALSVGHAKALLGIASYDVLKSLAQKIKAEQLSVRRTEELARKAREEKAPAQKVAPAGKKEDVHVKAAEEALMKRLGTKVKIDKNGPKGRIEIYFFSDEELDRVFAMITKNSVD